MDFAKRKKDIVTQGPRIRDCMNWDLFCEHVDLQGCFRGHWHGVVMPHEGYEEIARHFGHFCGYVENSKRLSYDKLKVKLDQEVIHGCLEDSGSLW